MTKTNKIDKTRYTTRTAHFNGFPDYVSVILSVRRDSLYPKLVGVPFLFLPNCSVRAPRL